MATLRSLNIRITANASPLEKSLANMQLKLANFSEQTTRLGKSLSTFVTGPLAGLAAISIRNFDKQSKAIAKIESGIKSTGSAAGLTSRQLQAMASELQKNSLFGDEEILDQVTSTLLTFTKIHGDTFKAAQQNVVDYAAKLNIDLQSAALQVGKALNDPIKGIGALSRAGVQFTDQQKEQIRVLQESGRVTEAQTVILKELETQFKGSAKAISEAGLGPITQIKNTLGDLSEEIGEVLMPVVNNLSKFLQRVVENIQGMDSETRTAIVGWGLFAAALGPGIFALGKIVALGGGVVKSIRLMVAAFKTGSGWIGAFTSSVGMTVAAIAALGLVVTYVIKNWKVFYAQFHNIWEKIAFSVSYGIASIKKTLNNWQESLGINLWKFENDKLKAPDLIDVPSFQSAGEFIKSLGKDLAGLVGIQSKAASSVADSIGLPSTDTGGAGGGGASGGGGGGSKGWGGAAQENIAKIAAGYQGVALSIKSATVAHAEMTMKMVEGTTSALTAMQNMTLGLADSFSQLAESGSASMSDLSKAVVSEIRKMIVAKIKLGVASAIGEKMAAGPFGIFLAAGAGLAASAIFSRILGSLKIPALAQGGAAFGPTLAMVGDNPNAMRDPELIMPFSKMKKMILDDIMPGAGRVQEVRIASSAIEIDGRKLRILLEQENNYARGLR